MRQIALYVGPSGQQSTYPLRAGVEAPTQIVSASGEVRDLLMVHHVPDVTDAERDAAHAGVVS